MKIIFLKQKLDTDILHSLEMVLYHKCFLTLFSRKMLYTFSNIDTTEPLWPVFGTYNPYSVHVELTLKTGRDIVSIPDILRPVIFVFLVLTSAGNIFGIISVL